MRIGMRVGPVRVSEDAGKVGRGLASAAGIFLILAAIVVVLAKLWIVLAVILGLLVLVALVGFAIPQSAGGAPKAFKDAMLGSLKDELKRGLKSSRR